jgi:hypothetical protein
VHEAPWATVLREPLADGVAWLKACAPVQAFVVYVRQRAALLPARRADFDIDFAVILRRAIARILS